LVDRSIVINLTRSRAIPRRSGGSLADSSAGRWKEKGVDINNSRSLKNTGVLPVIYSSSWA
jgi:hypothetical protein